MTMTMCQSPSSRRAWIEIASVCGVSVKSWVALLAEGVDRNLAKITYNDGKEEVALLAEGVDRNSCRYFLILHAFSSPSSRRAWIEMAEAARNRAWQEVALLAEGVDRNSFASSKVPLFSCRPPRGGRG